MRRAALFLCGCNAIFGLGDVAKQPAIDAQLFDGRSQFACPPTGTVPAYSPFIQSALVQNCSYYSISPDRGVAQAICADDTGTRAAYEGPVAGPLTQIAGFPDFGNPNLFLFVLRFAPEGDRAFASWVDESSSPFQYVARTYRRQSNGTWIAGGDFRSPQTTGAFVFSAPSHGPNAHLLVTASSDPDLHEIVETAPDVWSEPSLAYATSALGVGRITTPNLSSDGKRLIMTTNQTTNVDRTLYVDRASPQDRFTMMALLSGVPAVYDLYLTDDCGRVYFSGFEQVFYVQEQ